MGAHGSDRGAALTGVCLAAAACLIVLLGGCTGDDPEAKPAATSSTTPAADTALAKSTCASWSRVITTPKDSLAEMQATGQSTTTTGRREFVEPAEELEQIAKDAPDPVAGAVRVSAVATKQFGLALDDPAVKDVTQYREAFEAANADVEQVCRGVE